MSAVVIAKEVFPSARDWTGSASARRGRNFLPLNEAAEKQRATSVEQNFGTVAPGRRAVHHGCTLP